MPRNTVQPSYRKPPSILRRIFSFVRVLRIAHIVVVVYAASIWGMAPHHGPSAAMPAESGFWFSMAVGIPLAIASGTAFCALLTGNLCAMSVFFSILLSLTCAGLPFMTHLNLAACAIVLFLALLYFVTAIFLIRYLLSLPEQPRPL